MFLYSFFYGQNEKGKEKKKYGKKFDPPPLGFEPRIFEQNFPAQSGLYCEFQYCEFHYYEFSKKSLNLPYANLCLML
jgi:hypothetical protein